MKGTTALILAAGEGKRMKSRNSKVINKLCGKTMIEWVYTAAKDAGIDDCILVVGHRADQVKEVMGDRVAYVMQEKQLGTGHAVMQARSLLEDREGCVVAMCGDVPLVTPNTINGLIKCHIENGNSATVVTACPDNPSGYGRIIRDEKGEVSRIVEERDASEGEKKITEVNAGMYCFNIKDVLKGLDCLSNDNSQGEYYITDLVAILRNMGVKVGTMRMDDWREMLGVNDRVQLYETSNILRHRILNKLMKSGVTIIDPASTHIEDTVEIGIDTVIYPGTIIEGKSAIGENCTIGPNTRIVNSVIGNSTEVQSSVVLQSSIGEGAHIGPFAYIRPESNIGNNVKVGAFVEVKNSRIDDGTKVAHLTYVGDAEIGRNVNVGCGVVFVNYDGRRKSRTVVGDNAFIGSNVNLVAPVTVGDNAFIAAGSTITDEVPAKSLAIARERQTVKEGWVTKKGLEKS